MSHKCNSVPLQVLDATFDDLVPLAVSKMPSSWGGLVAQSVRSYLDLNIAEKLIEYQGPILLIRRTRDEMISTDMPADSHPNLASNRGNNLLLKVLQFRYPTIVDNTTLPVMKEFLSGETFRQVQMLQEKQVEYEVCNDVISQHVAQNGTHYPMAIEVDQADLKVKLSLFLSRQYKNV
ncbi:abhydrolase domain-containing protein 16A [Elysia marginata]|uniref:Abhydrolase domain-containing protein 16A n=1 Tax=Elysia marginata TaxID=1093978 RepID=A0AAV4H1M1_9GAST|nr:abhydrolase domain-containing protein 16A [Elysia marginata]